MANTEMRKVVVKRNSIEHQAIEAGTAKNVGDDMVGRKEISRLPRWVRESWQGWQFTEFSIYLSEAALKAVKNFCAEYTEDPLTMRVS